MVNPKLSWSANQKCPRTSNSEVIYFLLMPHPKDEGEQLLASQKARRAEEPNTKRLRPAPAAL
jgi:hypothetical protein